MNFIYLHVNRICVTPKIFEREIYEQQSHSLRIRLKQWSDIASWQVGLLASCRPGHVTSRKVKTHGLAPERAQKGIVVHFLRMPLDKNLFLFNLNVKALFSFQSVLCFAFVSVLLFSLLFSCRLGLLLGAQPFCGIPLSFEMQSDMEMPLLLCFHDYQICWPVGQLACSWPLSVCFISYYG